MSYDPHLTVAGVQNLLGAITVAENASSHGGYTLTLTRWETLYLLAKRIPIDEARWRTGGDERKEAMARLAALWPDVAMCYGPESRAQTVGERGVW